jgi:hypothetical protein
MEGILPIIVGEAGKASSSGSTCILPDGRVAFRCCAPVNASVYVAGSFNEWHPHSFKLEPRPIDHVFELVASIPPGVL